ncbi:MAG: hypothetical protein WC654_07060 [Patescibacteria group bacterium]
MSEIWPNDVVKKLSPVFLEPMRPLKCLLLMPFESRFDAVAEIIGATLVEATKRFNLRDQPKVERLDWITSSGVIDYEIWQKILEANLIFCDITGHNPNVMFEAGVAAAWKSLPQFVLIKDHFFRQPPAFDIAPIRYTEYSLTSDGIPKFRHQLVELCENALIAFPDSQIRTPELAFPLSIDFKNNRDDLRIYTPSFAHRRVIDDALEFGAPYFFDHSWASIGKEPLLNFFLEFDARFSSPVRDNTYIGVGFRSQHYFANYAHILYLRRDGVIVVTEPNEQPPDFYKDNLIREATKIDEASFHHFSVRFDPVSLVVGVDDFVKPFNVAQMKKVFGPGLVRFQSYGSWMAVKNIKLEKL